MAEQWEYLMVEMEYRHVDKMRWGWQVRPLAENGSRSEQSFDAPASLNAYGEQGWELVSTGNNSDGAGTGKSYLIFKRCKA